MEANKIDKYIQEKLQHRTFTPSVSAWERLSVQLEEQPKKKKKGWFFFTAIAASILLLFSLGLQLFTTENQIIKPKDEVVLTPLDKKMIDTKIDQLINEIPVEETLVTKETYQQKIIKPKVVQAFKDNKKQVAAKINSVVKTKIPAKETENISKKPTESIKIAILEQDPNSTIKVNAEDLLYAVTHSPKEVKAYYAKYDVSRDDVLNTIKNELKKSNIKINSNTILAEVERAIDNDDFQNNFMKSLKRRVSDIATAIASRNN